MLLAEARSIFAFVQLSVIPARGDRSPGPMSVRLCRKGSR